MWLYMPEDEQVFINKNLKEVVDKIGLLFLSEESEIHKKYTISMVKAQDALASETDKKAKSDKKKYTTQALDAEVTDLSVFFEFLPKNKDTFLKAIFKIDTNKFLISRVILYDLARNRTVINLEDIKFNVGTEDSFFEFTPPKNTEIYTSDSYK